MIGALISTGLGLLNKKSQKKQNERNQDYQRDLMNQEHLNRMEQINLSHELNWKAVNDNKITTARKSRTTRTNQYFDRFAALNPVMAARLRGDAKVAKDFEREIGGKYGLNEDADSLLSSNMKQAPVRETRPKTVEHVADVVENLAHDVRDLFPTNVETYRDQSEDRK
jgi:hypothetical protein